MKIWIMGVGEPAIFHPNRKKIKPHRSAYLAIELANRGHEVLWWSSNFQHDTKIHLFPENKICSSHIKNIKYILIKAPGYKSNVSISRYFDHKVLTSNFRSILKNLRPPDIIISSWPPVDLSYACVEYAYNNNIKSILDIRDLWPDIIYLRLFGNLGKLKYFRFLLDYEYFTKMSFKKSTAILGITPFFVKWARDRVGLKIEKFDKSFFLSSDVNENYNIRNVKKFWEKLGVIKKDGKKVIIWVGTLSNQISSNKFLELFLNLAKEFKGKFLLVICGKGALEKKINKIQETKNDNEIIYAGYINREQYQYLLEIADFGLLPYDNTFDFINSVPNKVTEYLSGGLQIISSLNGITKDLLEKEGVYHYFDMSFPKENIKTLKKLINMNPKILHNKSKTSKKKHTELFEPSKIYKAFADQVEKIYEN